MTTETGAETPDVFSEWETPPEAYDTGVVDLWSPHEGDDRPVGADGTWLDSRGVCAWMRERSEHVMLGFSGGKDSIATWHRLREFWPAANIHVYYLYLHPDIANINRTLAYYEAEFDTEIVRLPNRSVFRLLNDGTFQTPANLPVIWGALMPDFRYRDIYALLAEHWGIFDDLPWVAHGVRAADSPMRRMLIMRHGPWRPAERVFYPVWDWRVADVRALLRSSGTRLPVDYRLYGRSYDGLDHRFTAPLREAFPEDYDTLTGLYPMVGLDTWRRGGPKPDEW